MASRVLVDGDLIVYRAGWATEKTKYLVETDEVFEPFDNAKDAHKYAESKDSELIWSRKDLKNESEAIALVDIILRDIRARYDDGEMRVYLTTEMPTFRDFLATRTRYKAGRSNRPGHYAAIRKHMIEEWGAIVTKGEEADDAIGIAADEDSVIVSFDKDLNQIPGLHYDWTTKDEFTISKRDAAVFFYNQILSGDPTDTIPGIEGIGPKKAFDALLDVKGPKEAWARVLDLYVRYYGDDGPKFALETARLVYIRRKDGETWQPPV